MLCTMNQWNLRKAIWYQRKYETFEGKDKISQFTKGWGGTIYY